MEETGTFLGDRVGNGRGGGGRGSETWKLVERRREGEEEE